MDPLVVAALVGVASSLGVQAAKREHSKTLENILVTIGAALGLGSVTNGGLDINTLVTVLSAFTWHGAVGGSTPMQALKEISLTDRLIEGVSKAVGNIASKPPPG